MPITSTVGSGGSTSGVSVTGDVRDGSGGGGGDRDVQMMLAIDNTLVEFVSAHPPGYKRLNTDGHIQLWWTRKLRTDGMIPFRVRLRCKAGASGPTTVGLSVCSVLLTPASKHEFHASTHTIYHGHKCRRPHKKKAKKKA